MQSEILVTKTRNELLQYCPKVLDPHFDEFPGFSGFFDEVSLETKANFRDAYCPNPRELSNDISLCLKYRGENSAKMRLSRKFVANFRANFRSVLQAFLRKVQTP